MLFALLLMSLLDAAPAAHRTLPSPPAYADAGAQVVTPDRAEALALEGQYEAALDAFRRLAAANPRDLASRMWIARLHGLMGNHELAEPVYHAVVLEDPGSVDAIVGLGNTLVALGRIDDGIAMLRRAEKIDPRNTEILTALATAHRLAGRTSFAVLYGETAVTVAPTVQTRQTLEQARMVHNHRVEFSSFGERYNTSVQDTGSADLRVNFRLKDRLRVTGRAQHQRKFRFSEQRGGGGLEWRWQPNTFFLGHVLIGPDNVVLPRVDVNGEVAHTFGPSLWTAGYRFFDFGFATVSVLSPTVTWWPTSDFSIGAEYHAAIADFDASADLHGNHSGTVRAAYRLLPRLWVTTSATRGTENFDTLSPDRIGEFQANTVSGGARIDLPSLTSVLGVYEHQWRPTTIRMHRLTISLAQRF